MKKILLMCSMLFLLLMSLMVFADSTAAQPSVQPTAIAAQGNVVAVDGVVVKAEKPKVQLPVLVVKEVYTLEDFSNLLKFAWENFRVLSPTGWAIFATMLFTMLFKFSFLEPWFKGKGAHYAILRRIVIIILSTFAAILAALYEGNSKWYDVLYSSLLVGGGAQMLFENVVSIMPKWGTVLNVIIKVLSIFKQK